MASYDTASNVRQALGQGGRVPVGLADVSRRRWGGHLEALMYAREHGCPWNEWVCHDAVKGGHLAVLQWARERNCPWNAWTRHSAAAGGHREVLKWALEHGCPW